MIHSWRGPESLAEAVKKGYIGLLSAGYYIDLSYPASNHYRVDPVAADKKSEQAGRGAHPGRRGHDNTSARKLSMRIWPRTAAIAERFWSPSSVVRCRRHVTGGWRSRACGSKSLD